MCRGMCVCVCVCEVRGAIRRRKRVDIRVWFSSNLSPTLVLRGGDAMQGTIPVVLSLDVIQVTWGSKYSLFPTCCMWKETLVIYPAAG